MRTEKARLARDNRINWRQEKMTPNSENHSLPQVRDSGSAFHIRFAHWIGVQRGRPGLTVASPLGRLLNFRNSSATGLGMTRAIAVTAGPSGKRTHLDDHSIRDITIQQKQLQRIGESSFTPI